VAFFDASVLAPEDIRPDLAAGCRGFNAEGARLQDNTGAACVVATGNLMIRKTLWASFGAVVLFAGVAAAQTPAPYILSAVSDSSRPALDKFRDDRRKPAETLAFAGVAPGMIIAELIPGNGYYTRILAKAVGPTGKVFTVPFGEPRAANSAALAKDPAYPNVQLLGGPPGSINVPAPVDMVWTTQNYHDVRALAGPINKAVFAALKPGGVYFIVDHAAKAGAGEESVALHRIDEAVVKRDVLAAGFVLEAEGDFLRNPKDDHTKQVMERDLNRATDQFVLRFRKPAN
jgi:predicted methyltransferase